MRIHHALHSAKIPLIEAELLLAHVLAQDRTWIIAHENDDLEELRLHDVEQCLERRRKGEPIAYIIGRKEFSGREFIVNPSVLIPRPSTEGLVAAVLEFIQSHKQSVRSVDSGISVIALPFKKNIPSDLTIVDVGTGSGCIMITLALELPHARFIATDISRAALEVASMNAKKHGVADRIQFIQGSLLEPLRNFRSPFIVVSNPPYIPSGRDIEPGVRDFEPSSALFAGEEGMDVIRMLLEQARRHPYCSGIVLECEDEQAKRSICTNSGEVLRS
ncbi:MAG: peptide chain release factor N(5)-glutamine methyltransferase [Candidatus Peregrinibacteria bacterium]